jgi:hypothetical protein
MVMAAFALASTAQVFAQTTPEPSNTNTGTSDSVTGTVTSIDTTARTITVSTPLGPVVYRTNSSSSYMSGGRTIEFSGLNTNDRVTIYTTGTGDSMMLSRLEVMPATGTTTTTTTRMGTTGSAYDSSTALTGRVTSVDPTGRTITVETPTGVAVYRTSSTSRFMSGGRTVDLSGIHTNDRVTFYTTGTGDQVMMSRLEVMPAGTADPYDTTSSNRDAVATNRNDTTGSTTTRSYDTTASNLPRTASAIPLVGLAGLGFLGLALAFRLGGRWIQ